MVKKKTTRSIKGQWEKLIKLFRDNTDERTFNTWFSPISLCSYDEQQKVLTLGVPSKYVYEYLEQYQLKLLSMAIQQSFGPSHTLRYRVGKEPIFAEVIDYLKNGNSSSPIHFSIPDARKRIEDGLRYYLGDKYQWLNEYDKIAEWLTDNKGRGLLIAGTSGVGKSLICQRILPVILGSNVPSVSAREMNFRIDELLQEKCIIIDDIGKEDVEVKSYGNRRHPFFELCDAAEKKGILLIITTNLSTNALPEQYHSIYSSSIEERYGKEVLSRLKATTRAIVITHKDMRG